jgi:hypothetical protein
VQWIERWTLGCKKPCPRQKVAHWTQSAGDVDNDITNIVTGLVLLNIGGGEVEHFQEVAVQAVNQQETPVDSRQRYTGYLDIVKRIKLKKRPTISVSVGLLQ